MNKLDGFFNEEDGIFKGKGISAIRASRLGYNALLEVFGGRQNMPSSIMVPETKRLGADEDKEGTARSYEKTAPYLEKSKQIDNPELKQAYLMSGQGAGKGKNGGGLSKFPQNICRSAVLFYTKPGDIIFDPFAGHNSRMSACVKAGRHYYACDLCKEFMDFNFEMRLKLKAKFPSAKIKLYQCDSRKVPFKDEIANFTITSPPYWDIEHYGGEEEQLENCPTYEVFIKDLKKILSENFRVLKPNSYAIWFINDFRKKGVFYSYHSDLIRIGRQVGFIHHDIMIVDLKRSFMDCFPNQAIARKILPKRHEYGIVFRKPKE